MRKTRQTTGHSFGTTMYSTYIMYSMKHEDLLNKCTFIKSGNKLALKIVFVFNTFILEKVTKLQFLEKKNETKALFLIVVQLAINVRTYNGR